jgi:hypothetical protein
VSVTAEAPSERTGRESIFAEDAEGAAVIAVVCGGLKPIIVVAETSYVGSTARRDERARVIVK